MADESGTREQLRENWRGLQAEVESLREQLKVATELGPLYRKWQEAEVRAEAAEAKLAEVQADSALRSETIAGLRAKLAEVEKERDEATHARDHASSDAYARGFEAGKESLRASMDRARELAAQGGDCMICREVARLLSGDEERPNPAHPDWFPPDGTGKAE